MEHLTEEPKVIQSSDFLYKSKSEWVTDIPYTPPEESELKLLEGTINATELLKREREEVPIELSSEQKRRNAINIVKVVSLHRVGLNHYIFNPYKLSNQQKKKYKESMAKVLEEYNESSSSRDTVIKEFNELVCDSILDNSSDVSQYPVYNDNISNESDRPESDAVLH